MTSNPIFFEEYFEIKEDEVSPFIEKSSKRWGVHLHLKTSLLAAFFLLLAFFFSFKEGLQSLGYIFLLLVYFIAGIPSLIDSLEELLSFEVNIDVLMTLAAFSSIFIGSGLEGGLLLVLFSVSHALEDFVTHKAKGDMARLHNMSPTKATIIGEKGLLYEKSIKDIAIGTKILVKAHQMVPLDGVVIEGISSLSLSHLTGENLPIKKEIGDEVPSGAYNLEGTLTLKVTRLSQDSTLFRIIQMVTEAEKNKPKLQRVFDRFSRAYAISIIGISIAVAALFPLFLSLPFLGYEGSIYRALAFLIAASPCALIIALPTAYLSAIGSSARQGILLKGGTVLDALAECSAIAFDKTGTLTTGDLSYQNIFPLNSENENKKEFALRIAYSLERNSDHPIARALIRYGEKNFSSHLTITEFKSIPGYGLSGIVENKKVYIGHVDYIKEKEILKEKLSQLKEKGYLISVLQVEKELFILLFKDTLRPNIKSCLKDLKEQGFQLLMLTGDHYDNASSLSQELLLDHFYADLKPEDKLQHVQELAEKKGLIMIGDGVNDAPALARATVGISMGKVGTSTAIDASDIILLHDNIELLSWLISKGKKTKAIVRQNLTLSIFAIFIAALPAMFGFIPLWLAVVLHEGGTVIVGLNGLRLLRR
jgi:Cd2+/Zn2+-exporting ATPase